MKLKKSIPALPGVRAKAMAKAEDVLLQQLPVDRKLLEKLLRHLNPRDLKFFALALVGASVLVSVLGTVGHERLYQAAVAREMKKQLAPVNRKLDELEKQNEELKRQNEELKAQLKKA